MKTTQINRGDMMTVELRESFEKIHMRQRCGLYFSNRFTVERNLEEENRLLEKLN
jgi:hypothetical protein